MPLFTSTREKRYWLWALVVLATIFLTLFIGQPLAGVLRDQNIQAILFGCGMLLIGVALVWYGLAKKPSHTELAVLLGIVAVYLLFFLRLGIPERSHLLEYSVLAILIHQALSERFGQNKPILLVALFAWLSTFLIGLLDEGLQIHLPNRVFDPEDIVFNGITVTMAIGSVVLLRWVRKRMGNFKSKNDR